ncbi:carbohydrate-binding protein [Paenibacillus gansuensis]|uniref:Carbohydrate-binding protein n=1 Tax=Paenibacillus gansuensis TaxID=306542 RepID=A0ABW5P8P7_9BACL
MILWRKWISIILTATIVCGYIGVGVPQSAKAAAAIDIYISPSGDDNTGDGTLAHPFKTITKAREFVRPLLLNMTADIHVYLRGGDYELESSIVFNENDSGMNGHQVIYENYPNETPVIYGGQKVTGWSAVEGTGYYKAHIGTGWVFHNMEENGVRSIKARMPNSGFLHTEAMLSDAKKSKMKFKEGDVPGIADFTGLQIFTWPGLELGIQAWSSSTRTITSVDYTNRILSWTRDTQYEMGPGSKYFLQGAKEFLDAPGEFYLDSTQGDLYYYPRSAGPIEDQVIVAAKTKNIFEFRGTSSSNPVKHIELRGLTVRNSDVTEEIGEYEDDRYAAVYLRNASDIKIQDSKIENTGANGITADLWVQHITISGNEIHDTGFNGIYMWNEMGTSQNINKNNTITNNHIHHIGTLGGHAGGIRLNNSASNEISYNTIHDSKRYAISIKSLAPNYLIGATIDGIPVTEANVRDFTHTQDNIIKFNDMYDVNKESEDTGVFESWGSDYGNIIENNRIHDSQLVEHYGGNGIYLDDYSSGFTIRNNIIEHLNQSGTGPLQDIIMFKGRDNKAINNMIANNNTHPVKGDVFGTLETEGRYEYAHNVVYNNNSTHLFGPYLWGEHVIASSDKNLFYHPDGLYTMKPDKDRVLTARTLEDWTQLPGKSLDRLSMTADPMFMNPDEQDYRFQYGSPAYKLGIQDINLQDIGVKSTFKYTDPNDALAQLFVKKSTDTVNRASINLNAGQQAQLSLLGRSAKGFVADLGSASIVYSSNDEDVAAVSNTGVVTAVAHGVARIHVTATKDGVTKETDIDVLVEDYLESIEWLGAPSIVMQKNNSNSVIPVGKTKLGMYVPLDSTTFSSDKPEVAAVDGSGLVTGLSQGSATITIHGTIGNETKSASVPVQIYNEVLQQISASAADSLLEAGDSAMVTVSGKLTDGSTADLANAVTYTSLTPSIASVSASGLVTGLTEGDAQIEVSVTLFGMTKKQVIPIYVYPSVTNLPAKWSIANYTRTLTAEGQAVNSNHPVDGLASYSSTTNSFRVGSTGNDIWDAQDDITYVYKQGVSGAVVSIEASVDSLVNSSDDAALSLMFREEDSNSSRNVDFRVKAGGGGLMVYRDGATSWYVNSFPYIGLPAKIKLERIGNQFTGYYWKDGTWKVGATHTVSGMNNSTLVGVALQAGGKSKLPDRTVTQAIVKDVSIQAINDTISPSVPANLSLDAATDTSAQISWTASTDNMRVEGYDVYRNGTKVGSTPSTQYVDNGLTADTTYQYTVKAKDAVGLESGLSAPLSVKTKPAMRFVAIEAESYSSESGVTNYGGSIGGLDAGDYLVYNNIDLQAGAGKIDFNIGLPSSQEGQKIEVRLDSVDGPLLGTLSTTGTADWGDFQDQSVPLSGGSGIHNLYLVFKGSYGIGNLNSFKLYTYPYLIPSIKLEAEAADESRNITNHGEFIGDVDEGDYLVYRNVDLHAGAYKADVKLALPDTQAGELMEIRADSIDGPLLGTFTTVSTGGWGTFAVQSVDLTGGTGTHDLYFIFKNGVGFGNIDWFRIYYNMNTTPPVQSGEKAILNFAIAGHSGTVTGTTYEVNVKVPYGTDLTNVVPSIVISEKATLSPVEGTARSFTAPVTYTVTAEDGTTQVWTVTVNVDPAPPVPSSAKAILNFAIDGHSGTINSESYEVNVKVPYGTDLTDVVPSIAVSEKAALSPVAVTARSFTAPVTYTVTAEDGTTQVWTVNVVVDPAPVYTSPGNGNNGPKPEQQVVNEESLKQDKGTKVSVEITAGKKEVLLPVQASEILKGNKLEIVKDKIVILIDSDTLKALRELLDVDSQKDAQIILRIETATHPASAHLPAGGTKLKVSGDMYSFELAAVSKEGKAYKLDAFALPVTAYLPYKSEGMNEDLLGVYYYNESAKTWEYVGGKADKINKKLIVNLKHFSTYAVMETDKSFKDVPTNAWYNNAIKVMAAKHIVGGRTNEQFSPEGMTTRAEFTAMLIRLLNLKGSANNEFTDVASDDWYAEAVSAAYGAKLVNGRSATVFDPDETITREEMAAMLFRAYVFAGGMQTLGDSLHISDAEFISEWAKADVGAAVKVGLMRGTGDNRFQPSALTTRAETTQALYNLALTLKL